MQNLTIASLIGALVSSTRVPTSDRGGIGAAPNVMAQLVAESASTARANRLTADAKLQDLVLAQTEGLGEGSEDELLLAQRDDFDGPSMAEGMLAATAETEEAEKECEEIRERTKYADGHAFWENPYFFYWNSSEKRCDCWGKKQYGKEYNGNFYESWGGDLEC